MKNKTFNFTKCKFLKFCKEKRHKKLAEILKHSLSDKKIIEHYNEIVSWIDEPILEKRDYEYTSDRYHSHLRKANVNLQEHNLLPTIRKNDNNEPLASNLQVAIYLDNIRSAHNVGSIIRTTEAFRLGNIYFSPSTPFVDNNQVQKRSMQSFKWVECEQIDTLEMLPKPIVALETSSDAENIYDFAFPEKEFTLVIGNEEYGCSKDVLEIADHIIEIPLVGRKNSLNAANAFAIAAGEIRKQKGEKT